VNDPNLDEITSSAPSNEEAQPYKDIMIRKNWLPLPPFVQRIRLRFGDDADGDPVVWVILSIKDDLSKTEEEIAELSKLKDRFRDDIIEANTGRWPFTRIEDDKIGPVFGGTA